jgi:hypothetical protein
MDRAARKKSCKSMFVCQFKISVGVKSIRSSPSPLRETISQPCAHQHEFLSTESSLLIILWPISSAHEKRPMTRGEKSYKYVRVHIGSETNHEKKQNKKPCAFYAEHQYFSGKTSDRPFCQPFDSNVLLSLHNLIK